jgi:hypothetical protein
MGGGGGGGGSGAPRASENFGNYGFENQGGGGFDIGNSGGDSGEGTPMAGSATNANAFNDWWKNNGGY